MLLVQHGDIGCDVGGDLSLARRAYFAMISILPQCANVSCSTLSTVSRRRTSHNDPTHRSCQPDICSRVFSPCLPTAVTLSPWESAVRTMERPIWPVAPKTSHTACLAGFVSVGGSQEDGRWSFVAAPLVEAGDDAAIGCPKISA